MKLLIFKYLGEQFLRNDVRSVSNSNLAETLSDDTDEETADNVFNCTNDEAQEDKGRYKL